MEPAPSNPPPLPIAYSVAPKTSKSVLAWWGVIPTLLFVAIQLIYGWSSAKVRATGPEYSISYLLGGIIGGLLISFVISWIVYLVFGKSQRAATITFSVMMALLCLSVLERSLLQPLANQQGTPVSITPTNASFGNFQFEIPAGWSRIQPDRGKTEAMILLNGDAPGHVQGMLKVDVGKPLLPDAGQVARSLAGKDGRVLPDSVTVDGTDGVRIETPSADMTRPRLAVVVFRDEKVYLIMAATNGADISGAFDEVLKSWRWNDKP
jgi:hypothetical protein